MAKQTESTEKKEKERTLEEAFLRLDEIIQKLEAGEDVDKQAYVDEVAFAADDTVTKVTVDGTDYEITPITQEIIDGRAY